MSSAAIASAIASALAFLASVLGPIGGLTPLSSQLIDMLPPEYRPPAAHGSCDPGAITSQSGAHEFTGVLYCDGTWARIGIPQSDGIIQVVYANGRWTHVMPDGHTDTALPMPCYHPQTLAPYPPPAPEARVLYC